MLHLLLNDQMAGTCLLILSTQLKSPTCRLKTGIISLRLTEPTLYKRVPPYNLPLFPLYRLKWLHTKLLLSFQLLNFPQTIAQGRSEIDILPKNIQNLVEILTLLLHYKFNFIKLNQISSLNFSISFLKAFLSKPLPVCLLV
jgi:hypothetical protein